MMKIAACIVLLVTLAYGHEWTEISGGLKFITGSVNYLWGVKSNDATYRCAQPCSGNWVSVHGYLRQVDANDYELWGTNKYNNIFKRSVDGSGNWIGVSGASYYVSASGNGYIWSIGTNNCSYRCKKPCSGTWVKDSCMSFKQIDGGQEYVYAVNTTNHIFSRPVDGSGSWRIIPGRMIHVSVGSYEIFGIDPTNEIYRCKKPCIGEWEKVAFDDGDLKQCDVTTNGVFAVTTGSGIYHHKM